MKGDITINVIITGLFAIGVAAFALYLMFKIFLEVQTINLQAKTERDAILLANALISHKKLVYCDNNFICHRGMLDANKLNGMFISSTNGFSETADFIKIIDPENWITRDKLDLEYENAINMVIIVDLDDCKEERCIAWGGTIVNLNAGELVENYPLFKFGKCLVGSFDISWGHLQKTTIACATGAGLGAAIGSVIPGVGTAIGAAIGCAIGIIATLWTPEEIANCIMKSMPEPIRMWITTGNPISHKGLPVNIVYDANTIHKGRVIVSLLELV